MLRKLLVYLGLKKAPTPILRYIGIASAFGIVPAALYAVWRNRERLTELGRRTAQTRA